MSCLRYDISKNNNQILDPRTKLLLLLTLPTFLLSGAGGDYFHPVRLFLSSIPFVLLLASGNIKKALQGLFVIVGINLIWRLTAPILPPVLYILSMILHGILVHIIPCFLLSAFVLTTTTVSEFITGMNKLHIPSTITIPLSVIFRFFPTVLEEIRSIDLAMGMRGINLAGTQPDKILEYRMIPTMMCSLKIGDELSAAALSRGLGSPIKRTSICQIKLRVRDYLVFILCLSILILWFLSKLGIYLW
ncbi:MAG TPA: energy-coupling factor transporter transmembrane protein EcfT [Clostridiaceae bacterium]|nr:energy-coupling factor transporter transmembrane protein EcfT [Clostridiaceae bacterium]